MVHMRLAHTPLLFDTLSLEQSLQFLRSQEGRNAEEKEEKEEKEEEHGGGEKLGPREGEALLFEGLVPAR